MLPDNRQLFIYIFHVLVFSTSLSFPLLRIRIRSDPNNMTDPTCIQSCLYKWSDEKLWLCAVDTPVLVETNEKDLELTFAVSSLSRVKNETIKLLQKVSVFGETWDLVTVSNRVGGSVEISVLKPLVPFGGVGAGALIVVVLTPASNKFLKW